MRRISTAIGVAGVLFGPAAFRAAAQDAISVAPGGQVGIGTTSPLSQLHVFSAGSGATDGRILAQNANTSSPVPRVLLELINMGNVSLTLGDVGGTQTSWQLGNLSNSSVDGFVISRQGDGVNEFIVKDNGDVYIENGTVQVTSSRDAKENFSTLSAEDLLLALSRVAITTWNYKKDGPGVRHIGPVAEEFHAAFGLGADDKHLSFGDTSGVALAAIQALHRENDALRLQLDELRSQNRVLGKRLEAVEQRLLALPLPATGNGRRE
jgi:hypothetical protein